MKGLCLRTPEVVANNEVIECGNLLMERFGDLVASVGEQSSSLVSRALDTLGRFPSLETVARIAYTVVITPIYLYGYCVTVHPLPTLLTAGLVGLPFMTRRNKKLGLVVFYGTGVPCLLSLGIWGLYTVLGTSLDYISRAFPPQILPPDLPIPEIRVPQTLFERIFSNFLSIEAIDAVRETLTTSLGTVTNVVLENIRSFVARNMIPTTLDQVVEFFDMRLVEIK